MRDASFRKGSFSYRLHIKCCHHLQSLTLLRYSSISYRKGLVRLETRPVTHLHLQVLNNKFSYTGYAHQILVYALLECLFKTYLLFSLPHTITLHTPTVFLLTFYLSCLLLISPPPPHLLSLFVCMSPVPPITPKPRLLSS